MDTGLTLEKFYDTYSAMLYNIALEFSANEKQAEEILIATFIKAHKQNLAEQAYPSPCITLIKLIIQTAHEHLGEPRNNFRLKQFENTPLLHKLLCEQISLNDHCKQNKITRKQAAKKLRAEFNLLRNPQKNEVKTSETLQQAFK